MDKTLAKLTKNKNEIRDKMRYITTDMKDIQIIIRE